MDVSRFLGLLIVGTLVLPAHRTFATPSFKEVVVFEAIDGERKNLLFGSSLFEFITRISGQNAFTIVDNSGTGPELKASVQDPNTLGIFWLGHGTLDGELIDSQGEEIPKDVFSDTVGSSLKYVMCMSCMGEKVAQQYLRAPGIQFAHGRGLLNGFDMGYYFDDFPKNLATQPNRPESVSARPQQLRSKLYPSGDVYFFEDAKRYQEDEYLDGRNVDSIFGRDFIDAVLSRANKNGFRVLFYRGPNVDEAIASVQGYPRTARIFVHSQKTYESANNRFNDIPKQLGDFSREIKSYSDYFQKKDQLNAYLDGNFKPLQLGTVQGAQTSCSQILSP